MPRALAFDDTCVCYPLTISDEPSETGARLLGRRPAGVDSTGLPYLLTIPSTVQGWEVSVFASISEGFVFGDCVGRVVSEGPHIHVVHHEATGRVAPVADQDGRDGYGIKGYQIKIRPAIADVADVYGRRAPYPVHKMGGRPYFERDYDKLEDEVRALMARGFVHLVQIDGMGEEGDADFAEVWPFAAGLFHILTRTTGASFAWACFWEL